MEDKAELYFKKYKSQIQDLQEHSILKKIRPINAFDVYSLGKMLEQWEDLVKLAEADNSVADLGTLPRIALDVITISYGSNPIAAIGSVQPIDEELGTVWYKELRALDSAGNITLNDSLFSAENGMSKVAQGYAAAEQDSESLGTTANDDLTYNGTLSKTPIRPGTMSLLVAAVTPVTLTDDGSGALLGVGGYGTINYTSGAWAITLIANPGADKAITATYSINIENASDINEIAYELTSKAIRAKVYALKGSLGMLKAYAMKKRFGSIAEDELTMDLANAINSEIMGDLIRKMKANMVGNEDWSKTPPNTVSFFEHKQTYKDSLANAEGNLVVNSGRGTISWMIAGVSHTNIISTLPGWTPLYDGSSISAAHIYGTLDGKVIIRVPVATLLAATDAICGFKGMSIFESAAVFAPYMPLTVTDMIPTSNPLKTQRAAVVWAAVDILVKNFMTKLTITS